MSSICRAVRGRIGRLSHAGGTSSIPRGDAARDVYVQRMMTRYLLALCLVTTAAVARAQGPRASDSDREAVRRASLDYIEGFYEGDTSKLVRALRADLSKFGFWRDSTQQYNKGERMTYAQAIAYAKRVKAGNRPVQSTWPKDVVIYEVQDRTAAAKVTAWWGTDYLLLGKYDGKWMISDVLWEGPLKAPAK